MVMYSMSDLQYQAVYNVLSFSLASMMATTMYLWFRSFAVRDQYKSAVLISGLVTFIAAYHYIRIFNSWVDAYEYSPAKLEGGAMDLANPTLTGVPFNDAYRYMDWLLTVPLLLIEILLVMKLPEAEYSSKAWTLGFGSALMIVSGYYGELVVTGDLTPRWICWFCSMCFFLYIVYELLVGLAAATNTEGNPVIKGKIQSAQLMTVISWCTYPIVYLFPMLGINAAHSVVSIQIGYCVSDIISKCGVGLLIYQITYAKSSGMSPAWSRLEEVLGGSSGSPRDEAARKLISNYDTVISDCCNTAPLTQGYLRRVSPDCRGYVDQYFREVARNLLGQASEEKCDKQNAMQAAAWQGAAAYMADRTQATAQACPGRAADMSEAAAAAFLGACKAVAS
jgi:bacteriorhodopsin